MEKVQNVSWKLAQALGFQLAYLKTLEGMEGRKKGRDWDKEMGGSKGKARREGVREGWGRGGTEGARARIPVSFPSTSIPIRVPFL